MVIVAAVSSLKVGSTRPGERCGQDSDGASGTSFYEVTPLARSRADGIPEEIDESLAKTTHGGACQYLGQTPPGMPLPIITVNTGIRGHRFELLQVDVQLSSEGSGGDRLTSRRHAQKRGPVIDHFRGLNCREGWLPRLGADRAPNRSTNSNGNAHGGRHPFAAG